MELHFKYLDAMQVADKKIEGEKHVRSPAYLLPAIDLHSVWVPCAPYIYPQDKQGQRCHLPSRTTYHVVGAEQVMGCQWL